MVKNKNLLLLEIIENLKKNPFFQDFKYLKSKRRFYKKEGEIIYSIEFDIWFDVRLSEEVGFTIRPCFGIRYDKIFKFLEKYYQGDIRDYKEGSLILGWPDEPLPPNQIFPVFPNEYFFPNNESNPLFYSMIEKKAIPFLSNYSDVKKIYNDFTKGILKNKIIWGGGGIWVFEQLLLVHIIAPKQFDTYRDFLKKYQENLFLKNEHNALDYFPFFDEIENEIRKSDQRIWNY